MLSDARIPETPENLCSIYGRKKPIWGTTKRKAVFLNGIDPQTRDGLSIFVRQQMRVKINGTCDP